MKKNYNNIFIFLAGFIFVASISSDPLIHDHLHDEHLVECELCENKEFDDSNSSCKPKEEVPSQTVLKEFKHEYFSPYFPNFQSRAPPKI